VKLNIRNLFVFGTFGLTALAATGGCSDDAGQPLGGNFSGSANNAAGTNAAAGSGTAGSGTAGTGFGTAGTGTAGSGTAGTGFGTAGTFGTAGSFGSAGDTSTGGAGGSGTAGAGGTGTAGTGGTGTAGTGGGGTSDFPANCPAPTGTHAADKLTRTCWKASASECSLGNAAGLVNPPSNAIDTDVATRFSTGAKMDASKKFTFDIDMGKAVMINGINVAAGNATDFPPQIEVDVSIDGTQWKAVACGDFSATADISFAAVSARYVRLINHGSNVDNKWWSIVNFQVFRSGADDTCGAAETTACTSIGTM